MAISMSLSAQGQFLKEKTKELTNNEKIKEKLNEMANNELAEARSELDSTAFSMAISVSDNADLINADSRRDKAIKIFSAYKTNSDSTPEEKARRTKDAGELAYAKGYYKKAESLFLAAKLMYEENDAQNINHFTTLANLGLLYSTMGRYAKAEEFTIQALEQRKENLGENSIGYGVSLNNLAVLQNEMGDYNNSENSVSQAIDVLVASTGANSMQTAIGINNQAMLYQAMGRYENAEELLKKVIDISSDQKNERSNNHQKFYLIMPCC